MKKIEKFFRKYWVLLLVMVLQIIPTVLNLIEWFEKHDWFYIVISLVVVLLGIILNEHFESKKNEQISKRFDLTKKDIDELSANTFTFSSSTVNEIITFQSNQKNLENRVDKLEKLVKDSKGQSNHI